MVALRPRYELDCRSLGLQVLIQALHIELQHAVHHCYQPNPAQTFRIMSIIVRLMRIIVEKRLNMLSDCQSACVPAVQEARVYSALIWPVEQHWSGPGLVCEDPAELGSGTAK